MQEDEIKEYLKMALQEIENSKVRWGSISGNSGIWSICCALTCFGISRIILLTKTITSVIDRAKCFISSRKMHKITWYC